MSKQIYIDSNGNEVQVSGTVNSADMLPIEAGSSKMTSEAIGDLSDLTTSVTSSLVGAVNEVNLKTKEIYNNTTYSNQIGTNVFTNTNMGDFRFLRITIGVSSFDSWNMTYILIPNCKAATTGYYQFASNNVGGKLIRISTNTSTTISIISSSEASICVSQVVGIY